MIASKRDIMATNEQQKLLFQAIRNNEKDLIKKLVEVDKVEFNTLGQDVFDMNNDCTVLGYVCDLEIMHYFINHGITPNYYDVSSLSFGAKDNKSKIEVLDYYLNNQFKDFNEDIKPKDYYDNFGSRYSVCKYLNPDQPLQTMLFLSSIQFANKNVYEYLKPKLKNFDINQKIPFRWDTLDDKPDGDYYYILEMVTKELSRKCQENERFLKEIENKPTKDKQLKAQEEKNQELREWISFLLDEGFNPFFACYNSNIYLPIDPFMKLILNREVDLVKKSIELFADEWDEYKYVSTVRMKSDEKDILSNILLFNKDKSSYWKREEDPEVYFYDFKPQQKDEIILHLAKNGYPFYKSISFESALNKKDKVFWELLEHYTPLGDGTIIFSNIKFSDEQNAILEQKGYALSANEQLRELIEKIAKQRYAEDELIEKAQKMIDSGVGLDDPMAILIKFFWQNSSEDYSEGIKLIVDNDLVSKEQFKSFFENDVEVYAQESRNIPEHTDIFVKYHDIKKPLFDKYKDVILSLDFKIQKEYFLHNCQSVEDGYEFIKNNIDEVKKKSLEWDIRYNKSWELYRAFIKAHNEFNLLKTKDFSAYFLKGLFDYNAPDDILRWADSKVSQVLQVDNKDFLEKIFYINLENQLNLLKEKPAILNLTDRYKKTLLHDACGDKNIEKINKLLDFGLKVNINDKYDYTPLDSFLKAKPDIKDDTHFETFKRLLKYLLKDGGKPVDSIKLIKPKKYIQYQELLNDYSSIQEELNQDGSSEQRQKEAYDNELVDVTLYRTEAVTTYKQYIVKTKVARKDLEKNQEELIKEYYKPNQEEFYNDWEDDLVEKFDIKE
jgi:hypothetical protein